MKMRSFIITTLFTASLFGQYTKGNTVIVWSKYKLKPIPEVEDHKQGDRRKAFEAYHKARNVKARLLLSSLFLTHYWTGHVTDVQQVNEFKNMNDATAYSGSQAPLNKKVWPNEEERQAWFEKANKYNGWGHRDIGLHNNWVKLGKR